MKATSRKEGMSKTDKTDPTWVKALRKDSPEISEWHDHRFGPCDIEEIDGHRVFFWQRRNKNCGYSVSYYGWHNGFYARPPSSRYYRREKEGKMRAGWRKARQDMLKLSGEDLEDYDVKSYQHRHSALWEMY